MGLSKEVPIRPEDKLEEPAADKDDTPDLQLIFIVEPDPDEELRRAWASA